MANSHLSWVPFYMELSKKLLRYENYRAELAQKVRDVFVGDKYGLNLPPVKIGKLTNIDPFTVFALFNREPLDTEMRINTATVLKREFGLESDVPQDFDGVPMFAPDRYCFYKYKTARPYKGNFECFDILWDMFSGGYGLTYGSDKTDPFVTNYDKALNCPNVVAGMTELTMGMYLSFPSTFLSLDEVTLRFVNDTYGAETVERLKNPYAYLFAANRIRGEWYDWREEHDYGFAEFSWAAYEHSRQ